MWLVIVLNLLAIYLPLVALIYQELTIESQGNMEEVQLLGKKVRENIDEMETAVEKVIEIGEKLGHLENGHKFEKKAKNTRRQWKSMHHNDNCKFLIILTIVTLSLIAFSLVWIWLYVCKGDDIYLCFK